MKRMKPLRPVYRLAYWVVFCVAQVVVRLVIPVKARGRENLKGLGAGYVVAPNHISAIDPLFVLMARGVKPKMLVMGKGELFGKNPLLDFFWATAGAFPVQRGAGQRDVVNEAMDEVRGGRALMIFPEGTRTTTGELGKLKSGAFVVAAGAGAPMVPCNIRYAAGKLKFFRSVTVTFGKPVTMAELGLEGEAGPRALREAKKVFTEKMQAVGNDSLI